MPLNINNAMNTEHWDNFYKIPTKKEQSQFAEFAIKYLDTPIIEFGSGIGKDLSFFNHNNVVARGVDASFSNEYTTCMDVGEYIKKYECVGDVYTRFFWHAIERELQLEILKWAKFQIFIEARTTEDENRKKVFKNHSRNFVDVKQLVKDLKETGYQILYLHEGTNLSQYKNEDPHLVRVIASKEV